MNKKYETPSEIVQREEMQPALFDLPTPAQEAWEGMPDFRANDESSFDSIVVHFRNAADREAFLAKMGEKPGRRKSIWSPKMEYLKQSVRGAAPVSVPAGRHPVYIISKGRWESRKPTERVDQSVLDEIASILNTPWPKQAVSEEELRRVARKLGISRYLPDPQIELFRQGR